MDVILLQKMQNLGDLGDTVKVRPGYARNYLIPQGWAVPATPENVSKFEARRAALEQQQAEAMEAARATADLLAGLVVTLPRKVGEEGRLFGSVGTQDIAEAVHAAGIEIRRQQVRLPAGALRETGEHSVAVHLHADVEATVTVRVVPEE